MFKINFTSTATDAITTTFGLFLTGHLSKVASGRDNCLCHQSLTSKFVVVTTAYVRYPKVSHWKLFLWGHAIKKPTALSHQHSNKHTAINIQETPVKMEKKNKTTNEVNTVSLT